MRHVSGQFHHLFYTCISGFPQNRKWLNRKLKICSSDKPWLIYGGRLYDFFRSDANIFLGIPAYLLPFRSYTCISGFARNRKRSNRKLKICSSDRKQKKESLFLTDGLGMKITGKVSPKTGNGRTGS